MEYESRSLFASMIRVTLDALLWVGIIGIAYNLLKPGGWSYQFVAMMVANQPTSFYYLAVGMLALLIAKHRLDQRNPEAVYHFLSLGCSFAGTYFILHLLLLL